MAGRTKKKQGKQAKDTGENKLAYWLAWAAGGILVVAAVVGMLLAARSSSKQATGAPPSPSSSPRALVCENASPPELGMRILRSEPYPMTIDPEASYEAEVTTSCGTMLIRLFPERAPIAVNNFVHLAKDDFYRGQIFHRIDRSLGVIQAGDPGCPTSVDTCGTGGPGYTIRHEWPNGLRPHVGTVAMASAGLPNSSGSQFEIIAGKSKYKLPRERTIFGELVGRHSFQVASLILSIPTKVSPRAPANSAANYPDGEFVYITNITIIKKG